MKKHKFYLFLLFINLIVLTSYSQGSDSIKDFFVKVKKIEDKELNVYKMSYKNYLSNRKEKIISTLDSGKIISKHKIKYYKSGAKKEVIKYFRISSQDKVVILKIVKINDNKTFIKYCESILNHKDELKVVAEEILIDNKYYQKLLYDKDRILIKSENIVISNQDK
ncbi:MAG: hypothetical protein HOO91_19590 [Bacteroidales bacterium]|nr:hypothetical protein [Bacteroidales bacterium]